MSYIKINQNLINEENAIKLQNLCPFQAFDYSSNVLSINSACKVCKICVNKGPLGICEFIESFSPSIDKSLYNGIAVYIEHQLEVVHKVSYELIGKAKELAKKTGELVIGIIIGDNMQPLANEVLNRGVDVVYTFENEKLRYFNVEIYTNVIESFFHKHLVNTILFGGTNQGRSFAPRVAARLRTGLTADCTALDITLEKDLIQIRPAFGGNIMARIKTLNHRPQLATVRYKMFQEQQVVTPHGKVIQESTDHIDFQTNLELINILEKPKVQDISDAQVIIAVGRAFRRKKDLELIEPLRKKLNAEIACTRPLIENGWIDPRRQIGLSGRTVKPKLLINLGISGSVQFVEGMKESELIISVNNDPNNKLFEISHYSIVGDIYEIIPQLNDFIDFIR